MNRLVFCTFGSNNGYLAYCHDTAAWLSQKYPGAKHVIYSSKDLPKEISDYASEHPKGFGYYRWKPWLVFDCASKCSDGEILFYVDARSGMPNKRIDWLDSFLRIASNQRFEFGKSDIACLLLPTLERRDTTADLLASFGHRVNSYEAVTSQVSASFFAIRLNPITRNLISSWHRFYEHFLPLCRDETSVIPNHPSFINNRYDQSVFSLSVKQFLRNGLKAGFFDISEISKNNSVVLQENPHPNGGGKTIFSVLDIDFAKLSDSIAINRRTFNSLDFSDLLGANDDVLMSSRLSRHEASLLDLPLDQKPIDADLILTLMASSRSKIVNYLEIGYKSAKSLIAITSGCRYSLNKQGFSVGIECSLPCSSVKESLRQGSIDFRTRRVDQDLPLNPESYRNRQEKINFLYFNSINSSKSVIVDIEFLLRYEVIDQSECTIFFSGLEPTFGPNEPKWQCFIALYNFALARSLSVRAHALMIGTENGQHSEATTIGILHISSSS